MLEQKKPRAFTEDLPSPLIASRLMRCILLHWFARVRLPGAKLPPLDGMPAGVRMTPQIKDSISSFLQTNYPGTDSDFPGLIPVTDPAFLNLQLQWPHPTLVATDALDHVNLIYGPPGSKSAAIGNRSLRFAARLGELRRNSALPVLFPGLIIPRNLSGTLRFCMASNPLRYLPGFYQEQGIVPWSKVGSADWCLFHRIQIAAENCLRNGLNQGLQEQIVHVTKYIRCPFYWPSIEAVINLLLKIGFNDYTLGGEGYGDQFFC